MIEKKIKNQFDKIFDNEKVDVDAFFTLWEKTKDKLSFTHTLKEVIRDITFENKDNEKFMYPSYLIFYNLLLKSVELLQKDYSYEPHVEKLIETYTLFIEKLNETESAVFISILLLLIRNSTAHRRIIIDIINNLSQRDILSISINLLIFEIWKEPNKRNLIMKNLSFYSIVSVLESLSVILETKDFMSTIETNVLSLMYVKDPKIRLAVIKLLMKFGSSDIEPEMISFLQSESEKDIRKSIIETLGRIGTLDSFQPLFKILRTGDHRESPLAGGSLDKLSNRQGFENRYTFIDYNRPKRFTFTESLRTIAIFVSLFGLIINVIINRLWSNIPNLVATILSITLISIISIIVISLIIVFVRNRIMVKKYKNQLKNL